MRGKVTEILDYLDGLRITPAYAGKSRAGQATQVRVRDHPRVCGEKQGVPAVAGRNLGSPPRMRGKVLPLLHSPHPPGITPACAGKRLRIGVRYAQRKDHPRVCGEKRQGNMNKEVKVGSPPRMRGKASHHEVCVLVLGITPAYAGKSSTATLAAHSTGDHPRVCGEKSANPKVRDTMEGASPRMRGKVFFFTGASFCAIFFLEPSGNLLLEPSGSSWVPPDGSIFVFAIGLPPRVRGKAITFREQDSADGITPAYAGKNRSS